MKVMQERMGAFEDDMTQALIPFVDKTFSTHPRSRSPRYGGTLHGRHADVPGDLQSSRSVLLHRRIQRSGQRLFSTGNDKPDTKTAFHGALADPAAFSKRVHLLWIGVGTEEPERMKTGIEKLHDSARRSEVQARLLRIAGHGSRMADVASRPERLCAAGCSSRRITRPLPQSRTRI